MLHSVAILDHPKKPETQTLAEAVERFIQDLGVRAYRARSWDVAMLTDMVPKVDMLIVLGGDGSTLRAARAAAPLGKPVVSINFGKLGFLSELTQENWRERLPRFLAAEYWLEERMMLTVECWRGNERLSRHEALNDAVIGRGSLARVIRADTRIDGAPLTTYTCDGLIIATPTGSTAYALAAGGPVLPPDSQNFLVVPIAPHLCLQTPVVLTQGSVVDVVVRTDHAAGMSADGQNEVQLCDGDRVCVRASEHRAQFARLQSADYFYRTLAARLRA